MRYYKTSGLILKLVEYKDYDFIISILSPSHGKVSAVARGARRPKSRKTAHLDIFNFNDFQLSQGKGLDSISETKCTENFREFRKEFPFDLFYVAELLEKIDFDEDDARNIYELIFISLKLADKSDFKKFIAVIELKLLKLLGFEPELGSFLNNGKKFELKDKFFAAYDQPGYNTKGEKNLMVSPELIKVQRYMIKESIEKQKLLNIDPVILKQLSKINKLWIQSVFDIKLKSIKFLELNP